MNLKLLIVDDEKPLRDMLAKWFGKTYDCQTAPDAAEAMKVIAATPDLALMITDFKMPGENGLDLAKKAKAANPNLAVIILTAHADVNLVIEAMRDGVDDFFQKPVTDLSQLELRMQKALKTAALEKEVSDLKSQLGGEIESFTGKSPAMEKVYRLIRKVAPTNATVLVEGPSGTGKELVARALHNLSPRAKGPFVAVECAALSKDLLESELFGYVPGTFTGGLKDRKAGCFEAADGGTLFLDEIGEIDLDTQVKLLRAIESRSVVRLGSAQAIPVDFRLVTATNKNLLKMLAEGTFREDLYYRLNVIDIQTPALKDHKEDIALLASRFLKEFSAANGGTVTGIEPAVLKTLEDYDWPGNVRQLRNVIEKMVILATGPKLTMEDLPLEVTDGQDGRRKTEDDRQDGRRKTEDRNFSTAQPSHPSQPSQPSQHSQPSTLATSEREQILAALERCHGNKSKAADELGISRRTIHRKLREWGLT